jgi:hypothetical protein
MHSTIKTTLLTALVCAAPAVMHAQFDFTVDGRQVQVHSFASQGFMYSNDNNYMTMNTSQGSFAMTDGGVNVSTSLTDKFRVGAQAYDHNVGVMGKGRITLDWAYGDYKLKSWFGIRAGKVKTVFGLYNDTQDIGSLHTWALLPQSAYPIDLRASTIAHVGGDIYGTIDFHKLGDLSYTVYAGSRPDDPTGGYTYGLKALGAYLNGVTGTQAGADLRWNNLIKDVTFGASFMDSPMDTTGTMQMSPLPKSPGTIQADDYHTAYYVSYKSGSLTVDAEYRIEKIWSTMKISIMPTMVVSSPYNTDACGSYGAVAYRISKRLELGTYRSWFYPTWTENRSLPSSHITDQVVTARVDLAKFWDLKIEGHFMDGYGNPQSLRGFYLQDNPDGLKPKTNMLVIRTGWNF